MTYVSTLSQTIETSRIVTRHQERKRRKPSRLSRTSCYLTWADFATAVSTSGLVMVYVNAVVGKRGRNLIGSPISREGRGA